MQDLKDDGQFDRPFCFVFRAVLIVGGLGGLVYGYDLTVISGALLFLQRQFELTAASAGFLTGSMLLGGAAGAIVAGWMADRLGRRLANMVAAIFLFLGTLLSAVTPGYELLVVGRIVLGFGAGILTVTAPLYIAEIAPPRFRGAMVVVFQLAITLGILISYAVDTALAKEEAWRWMFGINIVPALFAVVLIVLVPQSPRWLMSRGKKDEAEPILQRSLGREDVRQTIVEIEDELEHKVSSSWGDLFHKNVFKLVVIGLVVMLIQQISGINMILYYAPIIFESAGFKSDTAALVATTTIGVVNFLMTIVAILFVDKWGRRPLFFMGLSLMVLSMFVLGLMFFLSHGMTVHQTGEIAHHVVHAGHGAGANLANTADVHRAMVHAGSPTVMETESVVLSYVTIVCVLVFVASFAFSLGPICFVTVSEIFPNQIRSKAIAVALMANWLGNFVVAQTFLIFLDSLGEAMTFWLYAIINTLSLLFIIFFVPETKQKTLEEIEEHFAKG